MKLQLMIAIIAGILSAPVGAAALKKRLVKKPSASAQKLSTDISFNDSVLHGHYQTPDEANARVENEKLLGDLLGVRTHFKDRLKKASEQN